MQHFVSSFYKFTPISSERTTVLKHELETLAKKYEIQGLMILATEGVNSTVSGIKENVISFIQEVQNLENIGHLETKNSWSDKIPFRRFKVALRNEIVTIGDTALLPNGSHFHLSPEEWEKSIQDPNAVVIDTRNWYETKVGKFKNAVELGINEFQEFPAAIKNLNLKKDAKVLMYCTGGIRCEKAILEMNRQGFENVYQLEGGILKYLEEFPNSQWDGECFVFDHRVAVDQKLEPSKKYGLCSHCGQPSDIKISCIRCDAEATPCEACINLGEFNKTCSKNCAHHYRVRPGKGRRQELESGTRRSLNLAKIRSEEKRTKS